MTDNTTIAAISTAQGEGGIGVIRISGEHAAAVADRVFQAVSHKRLRDMKGYTAAFGKIVSDGEELDEAVALVFRAPHSYTGEDVVELSCHGGIYITQQVLRAVLEAGAKPAQAGEFTKRAFLNGKIDLTEAEAVIDIISAKNRSAARARAERQGRRAAPPHYCGQGQSAVARRASCRVGGLSRGGYCRGDRRHDFVHLPKGTGGFVAAACHL